MDLQQTLLPTFSELALATICLRRSSVEDCILRCGSDDFSLEDALVTTMEPLPSEKPPSSDFDDPKPGPPPNPRDTDKPKQDSSNKDTGGFSDKDLEDDSGRHGGADSSGGTERKESGPNKVEDADASQGAIAGIVSAVVATVIGAVSSFIAYQKKKLCFKQSDEENVNMESHRGAQSEPPVQRTLLEN
ncbi:CD99 antigen-like [Heliangelus exortis]|uniref:CD99 antigen-like n=1 Tax=Heliangelus exortis TaxID=472823 RepID=UPI003A92F20D